MKKIGALLLLLSSLALANDTYEVIETRVENKATMQKIATISGYETDYDIDVFGERMNFEIEIEGLKEPQLVYSDLVDSILEIVQDEAPDVNEVYIKIIFDPITGEDSVLYSETSFVE